MLDLMNSRSGMNRRTLLTVGSAGIGGLTLGHLLRIRARAAETGTHLKNRSIIVINCQGGPTQFETFDPKMTAPAEIRSITGEIQTRLPGVTFGGSLSGLAQRANRMAIVRSYRHGISSHGPAAMHVMAGGNPTGAMMGSLYARIAGLTNPMTGMPRNVVVTSQCINPGHKDLYRNTDRVSQTGTLASVYRPFDPSAGGEIIENMKLHLDGNRIDDRRHLLRNLDRLKQSAESSRLLDSVDRFQQQAFDVLARGIGNAFHLNPKIPRRWKPTILRSSLRLTRSRSEIPMRPSSLRWLSANRCCWPVDCAKLVVVSSRSPVRDGTCTGVVKNFAWMTGSQP